MFRGTYEKVSTEVCQGKYFRGANRAANTFLFMALLAVGCLGDYWQSPHNN